MNSVKFAWFLIDYVLVALKFSLCFVRNGEKEASPSQEGGWNY